MYRNRKARVLRRAFGIGPDDRLPLERVHIGGGGVAASDGLLRNLYILGLVSTQAFCFNKLLSDLSPKKRDPLLVEHYMQDSRKREERGVQRLLDKGVPPLNIRDLLNIALTTGVNAARFYPNRQRMRGVIDWICALRPARDRAPITPMMRAQLARHTYILMNGGDTHSLNWEMLLGFRNADANTKMLAECWRELFACDPELLRASRFDEMAAGNFVP